MKKHMGKWVSFSLAATMTLTAVPVTAMADGEGDLNAVISAGAEDGVGTEGDVGTAGNLPVLLGGSGSESEGEDTPATRGTEISSQQELVDAIDSAADKDTITITQSFEISSTIEIKKAVTIKAADGVVLTAKAGGTYGAGDPKVFYLADADAVLDGLTVNIEDSNDSNLNVAYIRSGKVTDCNFTGSGAIGAPVTRGIMVENGAQNVVIEGNTFSGFFASAYINSGAKGSIESNKTINTKEGWCIADGSEMELAGNTFSGSNGVEMKIFPDSPPQTDQYADKLLKISKENPGARIQNEIAKVTAEDGVWIAEKGNEFADIQTAIKNAKSGETVRLASDITVSEWTQIWNKDGLTIEGATHCLTVESVESNQNGNYLLYNASDLTVKDLKIVFNTNGSAFSMTDGLIENVTFDGGTCGIVCGATEKGITVKDCVFTEKTAHAIYSEESGKGKGNEITGCTFDSPRAIILRSDEVFSNNKINGNDGVTFAATSTSKVTENEFAAGSHIEMYDCKAVITKNQILCEVGIDVSVPRENNIDLNFNYWGNNNPDEAIQNNENTEIIVTQKYDQPEMNTEGVSTAEELQAAVNRAGSIPTTITLANDITLENSISIPSGSKITIEGGQKTISLKYNNINCPAAFGSNVTGVPSDVSLTVKNTTIQNIGENIVSQGYGVLTAIDAVNTNISMEGCTFSNLYCGVYVNPIKTAGNQGMLSITDSKYVGTLYGYSVDNCTIGAYLDAVKVTYTGNDAPNEKEIWKNVAYVNGIAAAAGANAIQASVEQAKSGDVITLAPGKYEGIVDFDEKSITLEAMYNAYENGVQETSEDKLTEFTGTLSTFNGTDANSFKAAQSITVKGIFFTGDGLKVGDNNYNGVGTLTVENCAMQTGNSKAANDSGYYNMYNYFVKVSSIDYGTKVVVKDNLVYGQGATGLAGGTKMPIHPIQIWKVNDVTVTGNTITLTSTNGHQAINISKPAKNFKAVVSGNKINGTEGGIYITTWSAEKDSIQGDITVVNNIIDTKEGSLSDIHIGAEAEGQPVMKFDEQPLTVQNNRASSGNPIDVEIKTEAGVTYYSVVFKSMDQVVGNQMVTNKVVLIDAPVRNGYVFRGWLVNNELKQPGTEIDVTGDMEITASWKKKSSSSSSSGGGTSVSSNDITVDSGKHGDVTVNKDSAAKGDKVTITVKPDEGYVLDKLTVKDENGDKIKVEEGTNGKYTFTMPEGDVSITAEFVKAAEEETEETLEEITLDFVDVSASDWFYPGVKYVVEQKIMSGISDVQFGPGVELTRGMMVQMLYNLEGRPAAEGANAFTDVAAGQWYTDAVVWATGEKIVSGMGDNLFAPNEKITREQMVVMLYNYAKYLGMDTAAAADMTQFADGAKVSAWALDAVRWAVAEGYLSGMGDGTLAPQGTATRAEIASVFMRFMKAM